ncbi:MAG: DUF1571 domain-containing protein [Planctomycetaceae bacterium]
MAALNHSISTAQSNRRRFLLGAGVSIAGFGLLGWARSPLRAEPQIAARIEEAPQSHPLIPALKLIAESLAEVEKLQDYQATLVKNEKVGQKMLSGKMELKFRQQPHSVYLKFMEPHAGREVIYRPDSNNGKLLVHDVGLASLVGTVSLDPTGSLALEESRHPITGLGLQKMLSLLLEQCLKETRLSDVTVNFYPNAKIGSLACKVVEISHSQPQPDVVHQMTRLYVDAATKLPVRVQNYAFPTTRGAKPELIEDYFYMNLRTNTGLSDRDFDTKNPMYKF